MEELDEKTVSAVAAKVRLPKGPVEKALRLVSLLEECARDSYLRARLVLKGGTALNLFYGHLDRLSIDADFDYVGAIEKERMEKERGRVLARLEEIGGDHRYSPETVLNAYAGAKIHFRYESLSGSTDLLKTDVNFLNRFPILGKTVARKASIGLEGERTDVPCLSANELAGLKLGTMCVRAAPRDLFDVARFGSLSLDKRLVRKIALFRGFLESLDLSLFDPDAATKIEAADLKREGYPLQADRKQASREDLLAAAKAWTSELLPLDEHESEFQKGLVAGKPHARLLFDPFPVHPRIDEHPALLRRLTVKKPPRARRKGQGDSS